MVNQELDDAESPSTRRFWLILNVVVFFMPLMCCGVFALWVQNDIRQWLDNYMLPPRMWYTCGFEFNDGSMHISLMRKSSNTTPLNIHAEYGLQMEITRPGEPAIPIDLGYTEQSNTDFYLAIAVLQNGLRVPMLRVDGYNSTYRINMDTLEKFAYGDVAAELDTLYLGSFDGTKKFISADPNIVIESQPCGVPAPNQ